MDAKLKASAEWLRERLPNPPAVGVILGSGLGDFADLVEDSVAIPYRKVPGFPASAVVGHAGKLVAGRVRGVPVAVLGGRVHFYEGHSMQTVVFPGRVLGLLGCRDVIVTNAAGGIDTSFRSGDLMLIEDHINAFGTNPLVGANDDDLGPRFPDMSDAYAKCYREIAKATAAEMGFELPEGIYAGLLGPSYETPAEIRFLRTIGADLVGMSTVPETIVANHMGMKVLAISCVTNMAAGILPQKINHEEVLETGARVRGTLVELLKKVIPRLEA